MSDVIPCTPKNRCRCFNRLRARTLTLQIPPKELSS
jgi:hypothetical protein